MSIRENIVYGMPHGHHVSDNEIIETLRIANADFVLSLEKGLDTNVGNLGSQLSGG